VPKKCRLCNHNRRALTPTSSIIQAWSSFKFMSHFLLFCYKSFFYIMYIFLALMWTLFISHLVHISSYEVALKNTYINYVKPVELQNIPCFQYLVRAHFVSYRYLVFVLSFATVHRRYPVSECFEAATTAYTLSAPSPVG